MVVYKRILHATVVILGFTTSVSAITYNVIAEPPQNMDVAVVVDQVVFPLKPAHGILYSGEAPAAKNGYKYAFVDGSNIETEESFQRSPLESDSSTPNEFFNRPLNTYNVKSLPQTLPPLETIHRINSDLHIQNQIPTIHIYGDQAEIDKLHESQLEDLDFKLSFTYIGLKDVQVFENVKVSLAGMNTRQFDKLSYTLKIGKKSDSTLFGYKNIKLRSLVRDSSFVRENVCHHVLQSGGLAVSGFSYVRLFINNRAVGLFGLVETFQDPWTATTFANGDEAYQSGPMFQGIGANFFKDKTVEEIAVSDLHYEADIQMYDMGQYKVKTGLDKKDIESFSELQDFTKFINESLVGRTTESQWEEVLDVQGFLRYLALDDLLGFSDSYVLLSNNYYLYKDPQKNGRITFIPADFDATLGRTFVDHDIYTSGDYKKHPNLLFRPLSKAILAYPSYLESFKSIHRTLANDLVNSEQLEPYIDSVVEMISADVEWDSKLKRVGTVTELNSKATRNLPKVLEYRKKYNQPGLEFHLGEDPLTKVPLEVAVGPTDKDIFYLSVKDFISRKSLAVMEYYK